MPSDVKLADDNTVEIIGKQDIVIRAKDIKLDSDERRSEENTDRPRRALVHDHNDGLTINWKGDYPAGVRVQGHLESTDSAAFERAYASRLIVEKQVRLSRPENWPDLGDPPPGFLPEDDEEPEDPRAALLDHLGNLALSNSIVGRDLGPSISLLHELARLRAEVADLKRRVADLE